MAEPSEQEQKFLRHLERTENYFAAVREAGDLPWFEDPDKRAAALQVLGLPVNTPPMELRRAMFARRYERSNTA